MSCIACDNKGVVLYDEDGNRVTDRGDYPPHTKFEEDICFACNGEG